MMLKKGIITEKVALNIASKASGQKFLKNAKNGSFWKVLEILKLTSNSVTSQVNFNRTKIGR